MTSRSASILAAVLVVAAAAPADAYPMPGRTVRISVSEAGAEFGEQSGGVALTPDGRWALFASSAPLIPSDRNGVRDLYVKDLGSGALEIVTVASDGTQANAWGLSPAPIASISDDGQVVAFESGATNLVTDDTNGVDDVFVHDRRTGQTIRASTSATGQQPTADSASPQLTGDGRYVFFLSEDDTLVPGDSSAYIDLFRRDLQTGAISIVTLDSDERQSVFDPNSFSISRDGNIAAWAAVSPTYEVPEPNAIVLDVFVRDLTAGTTTRISDAPGGLPGNGNSLAPSLSADGRYVAFASLASNLVPGDSNRFVDVFVHDRQTGRTERVSVSSSGTESIYGGGTPAFSADGRFVAFNGPGPDLSEVPEGNLGTDAYVHDMLTGATFPASVTPEGSTGNGLSIAPRLSGDGSLASFASDATDLVTGDTNGHTDSFLRELGPPNGIGSLEIGSGGVSGWARFSGQVVSATDSAGDGTAQIRALGGEMVGGRAVWRPEREDVFIRIDLAGVPFVPNPPIGPRPSAVPVGVQGVHYIVSFRLNDVLHQVRIDPVAGEVARPVLMRCTPACVQVAALAGSLGEVGEALTASIPLGFLSPSPGITLTKLEATTSLTMPGVNTTGDSVLLPALDLGTPRVELGSAPAGTPAADVVFDRTAAPVEGRFSADGVGGSGGRVWARACLGTVCGEAAAAA